MRAAIVRCCLWVVGAGCLFVPVFDDPPLHSGAYLQDVGTDHAAVAIITRGAEVLGLEAVDAVGHALPALRDPAPCRRHLFALTALAAGTSYRYRVVDAAGAERDAGTLHTAPAGDDQPVHFAVVGDSGDQPWWVWLQRSPLFHLPARQDWLPPCDAVAGIGARIAAAKPDFVLHVGDIVYPWGHQAHYASGFFRPFAAALRDAPFWMVLGNHDILDDDGRQALANFALQHNDVTGDGRCFAFAWGPVRVIALDLGLQDPAADAVNADHPSRVYLEQQLAAATEPWLVVTSHFPIESASRQFDRPDLMLQLLPLLEQRGVDLYLCGHDHTYQRFGDGQGLVQVVSGGGGKDLYELRPDPRVRVAAKQHHWCAVEVNGRELRLRAHGLEGDLIDTVVLRKDPADPRLAAIRKSNPGRAARIDALK